MLEAFTYQGPSLENRNLLCDVIDLPTPRFQAMHRQSATLVDLSRGAYGSFGTTKPPFSVLYTAEPKRQGYTSALRLLSSLILKGIQITR